MRSALNQWVFTDAALAAAAIGIDEQGLMRDGDMLGRLFETYVITQLRAEISASASRIRLRVHMMPDTSRGFATSWVSDASPVLCCIRAVEGSCSTNALPRCPSRLFGVDDHLRRVLLEAGLERIERGRSMRSMFRTVRVKVR